MTELFAHRPSPNAQTIAARDRRMQHICWRFLGVEFVVIVEVVNLQLLWMRMGRYGVIFVNIISDISIRMVEKMEATSVICDSCLYLKGEGDLIGVAMWSCRHRSGGRTDERADGWTDERTDGRADDRASGRTDGRVYMAIYIWLYIWLYI